MATQRQRHGKGVRLSDLVGAGILDEGRFLINGNRRGVRVDPDRLGVAVVANTAGNLNCDFLLFDDRIVFNGRKCTLAGVLDGPHHYMEASEAPKRAGKKILAEVKKNAPHAGSGDALLVDALSAGHMHLQTLNLRGGLHKYQTTAAVALIDPGDGRAYTAHSGDSRVYCIRGGVSARQITKDHGMLNLVYSFLGLEGQPEIGAGTISDYNPDTDRILVCTDGLHDQIADRTAYMKQQFFKQAESIREIIEQPGSAQEKVNRLVSEARKQGSADDIATVLL